MNAAWLANLDDEVESYVVGVLADTDEADDDVFDDLVDLLAAHGIEDSPALRQNLRALCEQPPGEHDHTQLLLFGKHSHFCKRPTDLPATRNHHSFST